MQSLWIWICITHNQACNTSFVRIGHCHDDTLAVARANLVALNRPYVDLMLLHAPTAKSGNDNVYVVSVIRKLVPFRTAPSELLGLALSVFATHNVRSYL